MTPSTEPIEPIAGKRVFVTGAAGFIGGYLARRLIAGGAQVVALEHTPGKAGWLRDLGAEIVSGDLADEALMRQIIGDRIDVVMHIAAWLRGRPFSNYQRINLDATRALAQAGAEAGIRCFVFTSSIAVYGLHGDADVDESTPLKPYGDPYGDSKIAGERLLFDIRDATGLPLLVVRPGMVYGPGSKSWTVRLANFARRGQMPLVNGGAGTAYPVYIDNLVDLLMLCATDPRAVGEIFNGVDDGPVTFKEFLGGYMRMAHTERALRAPGWAAEMGAALVDPFVPGWNVRYLAGQLTGRGQVLNRKAKDVLGWTPRVTLTEGLARSEAWLREEHLL